MRNETILYATKIGEPNYMEEIITVHKEQIPNATEWAKANGFDRFRIAEFDGAPPRFDSTLLKA